VDDVKRAQPAKTTAVATAKPAGTAVPRLGFRNGIRPSPTQEYASPRRYVQRAGTPDSRVPRYDPWVVPCFVSLAGANLAYGGMGPGIYGLAE